MKRAILLIAVVALVTIAMTGCQFVVGIIFDPDFIVEDIDVDTNAEGEIVGVTITFYNAGGEAEGVEYAIYLSEDDNVNTAVDYKVYEDEFDIEWRQTQEVSVSVADDILPFLALRDQTPPEGEDYYIGVFVDPDNRVDEGDETDNDLAVQTPAQFGTADPEPDPDPDPDPGSGFDLNVVYTHTGPLNASNPLKVIIYQADQFEVFSSYGVFPIDAPGAHFFPLSGVPYFSSTSADFIMELLYDSGNDWTTGDGYSLGPGDVLATYDSTKPNNLDYTNMYYTAVLVGGSYSATFASPPAAPSMDEFEIDDDYASAREVSPPASGEYHTFDFSGDQDWFFVTVAGSQWINIDTSSYGGAWDCDTIIEIWNGAGDTMLAEDDDGGDGFYSSISFQAPSAGPYYVVVYELFDSLGEYYLDVSVTAP